MSESHKQHHANEHHHGQAKRGLHRDWRVWVVVLLMLAAMAAYVMSLDESLQPGGPPSEPVSAATGV